MANLSELIRQKEQQTEEWKQRKADERDSLNDMNDAAALRVTESTGAFLHYLDVQADNPRFSASNVLLAMEQNPEVTVFNSVKGWNGLNRNVMREEVGMKIRVGDTYVRDGRQYRGYKVGRVFDISQTTGRGQPAKNQLVDGSDAMSKALYQLLMVSPVPVVTGDARGQDALYDPNQQQIIVSGYISDSAAFRVLSREVVHAGIHDHGNFPYYSRESCALSADSVSYMLCRSYGVPCDKPKVTDLVEMFDGMEARDRTSVLANFQQTFAAQRASIQRGLAPQQQEKKQEQDMER